MFGVGPTPPRLPQICETILSKFGLPLITFSVHVISDSFLALSTDGGTNSARKKMDFRKDNPRSVHRRTK